MELENYQTTSSPPLPQTNILPVPHTPSLNSLPPSQPSIGYNCICGTPKEMRLMLCNDSQNTQDNNDLFPGLSGKSHTVFFLLHLHIIAVCTICCSLLPLYMFIGRKMLL